MLPGFNQTVKGADILINGVPSGKKTDEDGKYSLEVPKGFSGVIRPKKGTTVFIPEVRDYGAQPITTDRDQQDYDAEFRRITGRVSDESGHGVGGVLITPRRLRIDEEDVAAAVALASGSDRARAPITSSSGRNPVCGGAAG